MVSVKHVIKYIKFIENNLHLIFFVSRLKHLNLSTHFNMRKQPKHTIISANYLMK